MARAAAVRTFRPRSNVVPLRDYRTTTAGYRFIDKDPLLDFVVAQIENSNMTYNNIAARSGVSLTTLISWRFGRTKKPQRATMAMVLRTLGVASQMVDASSGAVLWRDPWYKQTRK